MHVARNVGNRGAGQSADGLSSPALRSKVAVFIEDSRTRVDAAKRPATVASCRHRVGLTSNSRQPVGDDQHAVDGTSTATTSSTWVPRPALCGPDITNPLVPILQRCRDLPDAAHPAGASVPSRSPRRTRGYQRFPGLDCSILEPDERTKIGLTWSRNSLSCAERDVRAVRPPAGRPPSRVDPSEGPGTGRRTSGVYRARTNNRGHARRQSQATPGTFAVRSPKGARNLTIHRQYGRVVDTEVNLRRLVV